MKVEPQRACAGTTSGPNKRASHMHAISKTAASSWCARRCQQGTRPTFLAKRFFTARPPKEQIAHPSATTVSASNSK